MLKMVEEAENDKSSMIGTLDEHCSRRCILFDSTLKYLPHYRFANEIQRSLEQTTKSDKLMVGLLALVPKLVKKE